MVTIRRASSTPLLPQAEKSGPLPPKVPVPKLSAGTLRPEPPRLRYSISSSLLQVCWQDERTEIWSDLMLVMASATTDVTDAAAQGRPLKAATESSATPPAEARRALPRLKAAILRLEASVRPATPAFSITRGCGGA